MPPEDARLRATYPLYGFALDHFLLALPPTRRSLLLRKTETFDLETRLRWESSLLKAPLTNQLTGAQVAIGLQAFRNISGFMGNRATGKNQIDHCFKLIRNVMPRATPIKDEIFCQLCKQLTGNPNADAVLNGWLLLSACLVTFPSSMKLAPFLERFFANHVGSPHTHVAQFAAACLASLHQWTTRDRSERKELPSLAEIVSMRDHTLMNVDVELIDGVKHSVGVNSWTMCGDLADTIAQRLCLCKRQAFGLFEVAATGDERRVDLNERVLDLLALWERLGVEKGPKPTHAKKGKKDRPTPSPPVRHHRLLYKVVLHIPLDDDMVEDLELVFKQAVHDVVHGVVVCPLQECLQLAALQLSVANSARRLTETDVHDASDMCIPSHLLSPANRRDIAGRLYEAYTALATDEAPSAQQSRHAYLTICGSLRLFGSTFFAVHNSRDRSMPADLILAVNQKGISLVNVANEAVVHQFPYVSIATWGYSANAFVFVVGSPSSGGTSANEELEYVLKTKMVRLQDGGGWIPWFTWS